MFTELLLNAIASGIVLGGFYAAVSVGLAISFGMLDIGNLAHPAFVILGSFCVYVMNQRWGIDPLIAAILITPFFFALGAGLYGVYHYSFERRGEEGLRSLAFFFGILFITEVALILSFGVDYRFVQAFYIDNTLHIGMLDLAWRTLVPCIAALVMIGGLQIFMSRTYIGRAILAVSQDSLALRLMAINPSRVKLIAFSLSMATAAIAGALLIIIQPVEPSIGRDYIGRIFAIVVLGGMGSLPGMLLAAILLGVAESLTATFYGPSWAPAVSFGILLLTLAFRPAGILGARMKNSTFCLLTAVVVVAFFAAVMLAATNDYFFFAGYVVLQYIVLATAWNILGGYTGYINFGTAGFFAIGAYSSVVLHKLWGLPIPVLIVVGGALAGLVGLGMGVLTLRLRGVFFAIGTLALAIVVQTFVTNWDFVGGSRGVYIIRPATAPLLGTYIHYLFLVMLALAGFSIALARCIERSTLGFGLAAVRDDEQAAEAAGVPTLKLKLISTTLSGALMGMAGAPLPYYVTYLDPTSGFNLAYAVNAIAMPLIGGMTSWVGPLLGAIFLGTIQQAATVTISSSLNLLLVGVLLVLFVVVAPNGIIGLWRPRRRRAREPS